MKPKTGVEFISKERRQQIRKHGFTIAKDYKFYSKGELKQAAMFCLEMVDKSPIHTPINKWPEGWDDYFRRTIINKEDFEKIIVAGAFCAAEIDRLIYAERLESELSEMKKQFKQVKL